MPDVNGLGEKIVSSVRGFVARSLEALERASRRWRAPGGAVRMAAWTVVQRADSGESYGAETRRPMRRRSRRCRRSKRALEDVKSAPLRRRASLDQPLPK